MKEILFIIVFCSVFITTTTAQIDTEKEAQSERIAAENAYHRHDYSKALTHLNEAERLQNGNLTPEIAVCRVRCYYAMRNYKVCQTALDMYFRVAKETTEQPEVYNEMITLIAVLKEDIREENLRNPPIKTDTTTKVYTFKLKTESDSLKKAKSTVRAMQYDNWGVGSIATGYIRGGIAIPFGAFGSPVKNTADLFDIYNVRNTGFGATNGFSGELGVAFFLSTKSRFFRPGIDLTLLNITTFPRPNNGTNIKSAQTLGFVGGKIGPMLAFCGFQGSHIRLAYQAFPNALFGSEMELNDGTASQKTTIGPAFSFLHNCSATLHYKYISLSAQWLTGIVSNQYYYNVYIPSTKTLRYSTIYSNIPISAYTVQIGVSF